MDKNKEIRIGWTRIQYETKEKMESYFQEQQQERRKKKITMIPAPFGSCLSSLPA